MFRNPRENLAGSIGSSLKPSTGRPPTPPGAPSTPRLAITMAPRNTNKPSTPRRPVQQSIASAFNKQSTKKSAATKTPVRANGNILNFFKKVDNPLKDDDDLFVAQRSGTIPQPPREPSPEIDDNDLYGVSDQVIDERYNEAEKSIKKRKLSDNSDIEESESDLTTPSIPSEPCSPPPPAETPMTKKKAKPTKAPRRSGPFLDDSDSDEESMKTLVTAQAETSIEIKQPEGSIGYKTAELVKQKSIAEKNPIIASPENTVPLGGRAFKLKKRVPVARVQAKWEALQPKSAKTMSTSSDEEETAPKESKESKYFDSKRKGKVESDSEYDDQKTFKGSKNADSIGNSKGNRKRKSNPFPEVPALKQEKTSNDTWADFEGMGEFPDEDANGEEFMERKWMEEQNTLEADDEVPGDEDSFNGFYDGGGLIICQEEGSVSTCPICDASLNNITSDEASMHVNACLDGNPIPLPAKLKSKVNSESVEEKLMPGEARNRYARKAAIPRPGQANPIELDIGGGSAFSKIMSGHAEDAAWASAADKEKSSRGKPAYQRTCPFYKIMPGLFICVDAFRYGAVKGCNAYFLSHFHSDHYIGLTSTWSHGPIYCSRVTGNLVKQQLKVDPKWVVSIDFDNKVDVPNTEGVSVTMIHANHCPGSSLFLFEKNTGRGPSPKFQRILHCGDFRACPAHIAHPLLMPNVIDCVNGKTKQQKIDVCYLDTTYLNPKYAFPSQDDVVKACADMCVSLSKENIEDDDAWETVKKERAGAKMTKFITSAPKIEMEDSNISSTSSKNKKKSRGRLLVVCGTYSIGKERIVLGIARALDCKIYAIPGKMRICAALEDPELTSRLTSDPREAQIHMQMLMDLRPETLQDYLTGYKPHFTRVVGFRPSGWSYKPPNSRFVDSPPIHTILHAPNWRSEYNMGELVSQRGSTKEAQCFGVPYSEHSSFRELTMFVMGLRIEKVVPTVNVGSEVGRKNMKVWIERWLAERRKHGVLKFGDGEGDGLVKW